MAEDIPRPPDDDDHTVVLPSPGGRRRGAAPAPGAPIPREALAPGVGNPLVAAASTLLALVGRLRQTASHPDVGGLRQRLVNEIRAFERVALERGVARDTVFTARYVLCSVVDEAVLGTPWGSEGAWSAETLLSTFHKETSGGSKFFAILDRLAQDPAMNVDLLELMYLCLAHGFKGKYMLMPDGPQKLAALQDDLFERIRRHRGGLEAELAPHWAPGRVGTRDLGRVFPFWAVAAIAGALLVIVYMGFSVILGDSADPVFDRLQQIATADPLPGAGR